LETEKRVRKIKTVLPKDENFQIVIHHFHLSIGQRLFFFKIWTIFL